MSGPASNLTEREVAIFLQTNEPVPAAPVLRLIAAAERLARSTEHFGPRVLVELIEVRTGTKLIRLSFGDLMNAAGVALSGASLVVAIMAYQSDLAEKIKAPDGEIAETIAELCLHHGTAECVISTRETHIRIGKNEIRAIEALSNRRTPLLKEEGGPYPHSPGGEYLSAEDAEGRLPSEFIDKRPSVGSMPNLEGGRVRLIGQFHRVGPDMLFREAQGRLFSLDPPERLPAAIDFGREYILVAYEPGETTDDGLVKLSPINAVPT